MKDITVNEILDWAYRIMDKENDPENEDNITSFELVIATTIIKETQKLANTP